MEKIARPLVALELQYGETPGSFAIDAHYDELLRRAGADVAFLAPSFDLDALSHALARFDGVVIPGGNDIDPALYGEAPLPGADEPVPLRDRFEPALVVAAEGIGLPLLGICRGAQILNVAHGGTLVQSLPEAPIDHRQPEPYGRPSHEVLVSPDSPLSPLAREGRLAVNSIHHQGIGRLGRGLAVAATAPDGVVEAVWEPNARFELGVQWHPELLMDGPSIALARAFVDACRARARR